jgi:peptide/nickel transport system permease protein
MESAVVMSSPPTSSPAATTEAKALPKKSVGYWSDVWRRYRRNYAAVVALVFVACLSIVAIFSPMIVGTKPIVCKYKGNIYFPCLGYYNERWENPIFVTDKFRYQYFKNLPKKDPASWAIWPLVFQDPMRRIRANERDNWPENEQNARPNNYSFFGTTKDGFDVFAQLVHGSRRALLVGFVSMGIAAAIGITVGAMAGYFGGWIDMVLSRGMEIVMCIPTLVLILAILSLLEKPNLWHIMMIIGFTGWTGIARLARGEFLKLKNLDYIHAARALGAGHLRVMFLHILPNALAPVLVPITFGIASAILVENALRFLGIGDTSVASWGGLLNEAKGTLEHWWLLLFPGAAIFLTVLAYNLIGEGLQEATDPRLRESRK